MTIEAKQFEDPQFSAQYFAEVGDPNAAQRKLSEDGAQINLMVVTICLAKYVQELKGVGTPEHDEELLADENTPASQRDAIQRGVDNKQRAEESGEEVKEPTVGDKNNPPSSPDQSSDSSVNLLI
jgi:hypothetical protein